MKPARRLRKCPEPKSEPVARADSFLNAMTGLNVSGFDKRRAVQHFSGRMTEAEAEDLWRGDHIIARAIETVPLVTMRNGFDVVIADEEKLAAPLSPAKQKASPAPARMDELDRSAVKRDMQAKLADLEVVPAFIKAHQYARAYGGGALWIGAEETGRPWQNTLRLELPLDVNRLKDIRHLIPLQPRECWPVRWYEDPLERNFGEPSHYEIQRDSVSGSARTLVVHESRLLRFFGSVTSQRQLASNNGWGDPIALRFVEIVADLQSSYQAGALLMVDFAQAVQKVVGLAELLAAGDTKTLEKRAEMIAMARSVARTVLIDSEEEYGREATPMDGMADILDRLCKWCASAISMPVTLLFGEAPAGLQATGDSDIRWFYDDVANRRELHTRPQLELLIQYLFLCTDGPTAGEEPASWKVVFAPLWQPTQKEISERNHIQAQADSLNIAAGVVTPEEVAQSRFAGEEWSAETKLDVATREAMAAAEEEMPEEPPAPAPGEQPADDAPPAEDAGQPKAA